MTTEITINSSFKKKKNRSIKEFHIIEQKTNLYDFTRKSYKDLENVPINVINDIIKYHFKESYKILHNFTPTTFLILVKVRDLLNAPINNWCQNREPDFIRIPDIASYINKEKKTLETILYLSYKNKKDSFDIIDGIHRYSALKYIEEKNKDTSLLEENEFLYNLDWLFDSYILINLRFNATIGELIELRNSLNLTQPMPTVLMKDNDHEETTKKNILESIANSWQKKFKKNFSSSSDASYLQSHGCTNRNLFIELLGILYNKYNIDIHRVHILHQVLDEANNRMKILIESSSLGSINARTRCKDTGCFLFIYRNEKLEDFI